VVGIGIHIPCAICLAPVSRALVCRSRHVAAAPWRIADRAAAACARAFCAELAARADPVEAAASAKRGMIADPVLAHPVHRIMG